MKSAAVAVLPMVCLSASCFYTPYDPGYPPYYGPPPPYGTGSPYSETGRYEPLPPVPGGDSRPAPSPGGSSAPQTRPAPAPAPPANPGRPEYPTAERTDRPNYVLSPYAPYNVIDVTGFKSGQLAKDPSNGKIFRVP